MDALMEGEEKLGCPGPRQVRGDEATLWGGLRSNGSKGARRGGAFELARTPGFRDDHLGLIVEADAAPRVQLPFFGFLRSKW